MFKDTPQDQTRYCPMCEDSGKRIAELEQKLAESSCREEDMRHENHNLNWALGSDGYEKMYTSEEQESADQAHAETLERIATMKKRGDKLVELEHRVKVLADLLRIADCPCMCGDDPDPQCKFCADRSKALNQTPQQTSEQIERWHIEWMMKLPTFGVWHQGDTYDESDFYVGDTVDPSCFDDCTRLFAIPPLPKESKE